jgi:hypothetical protein
VYLLASEIEPTTVEWLWQSRIPLAKITILEGDPGLGKSTLLLDLAARVSRGAPMPDGTPGAEGAVVILTAEDGASDTVVPRLIAAGGDLDRIAILLGGEGGDRKKRLLSFPGDIETLREMIQEINAVLVIVDPLVAFVGPSINTWKDQDVRRALHPFAELAEQTGAAVVALRHLTKGQGGSAIYRGGGSIGIIGAARSALLVAKDPEEDAQRVLAMVKSNLCREAPSLSYHIEEAENAVSRIVWDGQSSYTADELVSSPRDPEERTAIDEAKDFLRDLLAEGGQLARDVHREAREAGISERTLSRAKSALGVKSQREGFGKDGKFYWVLLDEAEVGHSGTVAPYDGDRGPTGDTATGSHRVPHIGGQGTLRPLLDRAREYVNGWPGCTREQLVDHLGGDTAQANAAVDALIATGEPEFAHLRREASGEDPDVIA